MGVRTAIGTALALAALASAAPAWAASDHSSGDGSFTNNPAMLSAPGPLSSDPVALREPYHPSLNVDWSLGLRGAYTIDRAGGHAEIQLLPSVAASHEGSRWRWTGSADATLVREEDSKVRLSALRLATGGDYALDSLTSLSGAARLSLSQAGVNAYNTPANVLTQPILAGGGLDGTLTRRFGKFTLDLRGSLDRNVSGPTTLVGPVTQDNADQNTTAVGSGLRLGFAATPIWTLFADAQADRTVYDAPSRALLVKLDGTTYSLKTGATGKWHDVLELEGSVGVALRKFDDAGVSDVVATLYDARIVFRPDPTLTLTASLSSSVDAPGTRSGGSARIDYAALGEVEYQVNRWLSLRGSVGWNSASFAGTDVTESGNSLGLSAAYRLNTHTSLTADYAFTRRETTLVPAESTHMIALGLRLSR